MVLHAMARGCQYGFDIMDETGLTSGTIYPALDRLEELGFAASEWEDARIAHREKRPARRYYNITERGEEALAVAMERYRSLAPIQLKASMQPRNP
ncbi:MAG: PadR family transcriptional regulator [Gemmatimonadota bacterium]|nr:MAG: PadR family transcriptional regulator [Gemmatimonadota bacterium]